MGREGEREGRREERDQLCALINLQYPSVNHMFDDINLVCENKSLGRGRQGREGRREGGREEKEFLTSELNKFLYCNLMKHYCILVCVCECVCVCIRTYIHTLYC